MHVDVCDWCVMTCVCVCDYEDVCVSICECVSVYVFMLCVDVTR